MPLAGDEKENTGTGAFRLLWRQLQDVLSRRFSSAKTEKRDRFTLLLLTALLLTLFITPNHHHSSTTTYRAGQIAVADVRASREYLIEDRRLTAEKQAEAVARVPLVYTFDNRVVESIVERIKKTLSILSSAESMPVGAAQEELTKSLADTLGVKISPAELKTLLRLRDDSRIIAEIEKSLQKIYRRKVVADQRLFLSDQLTGISLSGTEGENWSLVRCVMNLSILNRHGFFSRRPGSALQSPMNCRPS